MLFKLRNRKLMVMGGGLGLAVLWAGGVWGLARTGWLASFARQKPGLWGMPGWYGGLIFVWGVFLTVLLLHLGVWSWRPTDTLYRRIGWLMLGLTLAQGLLFSAIAPPWQSPDEHAHYEYAALMAVLQRVPNLDDVRQDIQAEVTTSMFTHDFWRLTQFEPVAEPPVGFYRTGALTEFPPTHVLDNRYIYYPQVGDEPPLYYIFPALLYKFTVRAEATLRLYVMRLASVGIWVALSAAIGWAGRGLFPDKPALVIATWLVALFNPALNHIGSVLSNDLLAALWCTLALGILMRMFKTGPSWRRGGLLGACVMLALLTKKSAFWLLPTIGLTLLWLPHFPRRWRLGIGLLLGGWVGVALLLWALPGSTARDWQGAPRMKEPDAPNHFLQVSPGHAATQIIGIHRTVAVRGQTINVQIAQRSSEEGTLEACLAVLNGEEVCHQLEVSSIWQNVQTSFTIPEEAEQLTLCLTTVKGTVWVDDVLFAEYPSAIRNTTMEERISWLERVLVTLGQPLNIDALIIGLFVNFNKHWPGLRLTLPLAWRIFFDSFWGNFGAALLLPLRAPWPLLTRSAIVVAVLGWIVQAFRRDTWGGDVLRVLGPPSVLALLQTFIPLLSRQGGWMPQGRFMFPAIWPVVMLLTLGWYGWRVKWTERWFVLWVSGGCLALNLAGLWRMISYFYG